jgi:hypothetical protein
MPSENKREAAMKMLRSAYVCIVSTCLFTALPAFGQVLSPGPGAVPKVVKPGGETMIAVHGNWTLPGCAAGEPVTLHIVSPPKHGRIALRPAPATTPDCPNAVTGTGVFYTPKPGFVGADAFSYDRKGTGALAGIRYVKIDVRP